MWACQQQNPQRVDQNQTPDPELIPDLDVNPDPVPYPVLLSDPDPVLIPCPDLTPDLGLHPAPDSDPIPVPSVCDHSAIRIYAKDRKHDSSTV